MTRAAQPRQIVAVLLVTSLVVALLVGAGRWAHRGTQFTAVFTRAVGLYPGDEVRVLGVRVGTVDAITPEPDGVHVRMTLDGGVKAPADADAVLVAPSLVSSRYVQLTPAWTKGPVLQDDTVIGSKRTSVPVEWDELKQALDNFAKDLGPDSADGSGPLGRAVDVTSKNLDGRGKSINGTIEELSQALDVLARNRGDIYGTVSNLAQFTATLKESDAQITLFARQMDTLTALLAANRRDLSGALKDLNDVMPQLKSYLAEDGPLLQKNIEQLQVTSRLLVDRRQDIADTLQTSPVSLSNTLAMYDPKSKATTAGLAFPYLEGPKQVVCFLVSRVTGSALCDALLKLFPFLDTSTPSARKAAVTGDLKELMTR
ncbi:MCE family protein [Spongisporangium articulatum]|uniref:MCE family protein n=1 Tax=Spongisporangium articulatum TaxID=3362603 RepID=A0ABW8ATJ6_9ACTN